MTVDDLNRLVLTPAMSLLPAVMDSDRARAMLCAIAVQESGLRHRVQVGGPAHGWWQFELTGVEGVLAHHASSEYAQGVCRVLGYDAETPAVYRAVTHNDILAACFARLLLWRIPEELPGKPEPAWYQYVQAWGPGKPRRDRWASSWAHGTQYFVLA